MTDPKDLVETQGAGVPPPGSGYSAEPEPSCTVSAVPVSIPNAVEGEVFSPRSTDDEASAILDELNHLQTWCVMQARHDAGGIPAADLVQRTRILIIERCKRGAAA